MTPLHEAALSTRSIKFIVRRLLNAGVEIDSLDNSGHSPLDLALKRGYLRHVQLLIEHGARSVQQ